MFIFPNKRLFDGVPVVIYSKQADFGSIRFRVKKLTVFEELVIKMEVSFCARTKIETFSPELKVPV